MDDLISRQAAIDALEAKKDKSAKGDIGCFYNTIIQNNIDALKGLPFAQSEIIYCKDCVKHNKGRGYYLDGTIIGIKDCCPLVEIRGMAQGHEFDYQYCAYAERKTDVKADKGASC